MSLKELRDELTRALIEANEGNVNEGAGSFNELVKEMTSNQDLKAFAFKTKSVVYKFFYCLLPFLVTLYENDVGLLFSS